MRQCSSICLGRIPFAGVGSTAHPPPHQVDGNPFATLWCRSRCLILCFVVPLRFSRSIGGYPGNYLSRPCVSTASCHPPPSNGIRLLPFQKPFFPAHYGSPFYLRALLSDFFFLKLVHAPITHFFFFRARLKNCPIFCPSLAEACKPLATSPPPFLCPLSRLLLAESGLAVFWECPGVSFFSWSSCPPEVPFRWRF